MKKSMMIIVMMFISLILFTIYYNSINKVNFKDKNFEILVRQKIYKTKEKLKKEDLEKLKEININIKDIESIDGIKHIKNLEKITIVSDNSEKYNKTIDIKEIAKLNKIQYLTLDRIKVKNLDKLKNLKNLKYLKYIGNDIDYGCLSKFENIKELWVSFYNNTKNIDEIKKLKGLKSLNFDYIESGNISFLEEFNNITNLKIKNSYIKDVKPLSKLENLENLQLINCKIQTASGLYGLDNLKSMNLKGTVILDNSWHYKLLQKFCQKPKALSKALTSLEITNNTIGYIDKGVQIKEKGIKEVVKKTVKEEVKNNIIKIFFSVLGVGGVGMIVYNTHDSFKTGQLYLDRIGEKRNNRRR